MTHSAARVAAALALVVTVACSGGSTTTISTPDPTPTPTPTATPTPDPTPTATPTQPPTPESTPEPTTTPTTTPTPESTTTPSPSPTSAPRLTARDLAAESIAEIIDGPPEAYSDVVDLLVDLWLLDAELGTATAKQFWITGQKQADNGNRSRTGYRRLLEILHGMASTDLELAKLSVNVPWFVDGVTQHEHNVLYWLRAVANKDVDLARLIATFPWFSSGSFNGRDASVVALRLLGTIATTDIEFATKITGLWLADGVSFHEAASLEYMNELASKDIEFAQQIAVMSWLTDGVNEDEVNSLKYVNELASKDIEFARQIAVVSWLTDGVKEHEVAALLLLDQLAAYDIQLARYLTRSSWFADGGSLTSHVLNSLVILAHMETDALPQLIEQPWFADGLNEEDAALVVTLGLVASTSSELYVDLLRTHYSQTRTASLKLAGSVNIWIFQNTPFPLDEDLPTVIEDTARISEELLGLPFPENDVILLVVDRSDTWYRIGSGHFGTHMRLVRSVGGVWHLPHETAHYWFFHPRTGPRWLTEGAAEFIARYVEDRTDIIELADSRTYTASAFTGCVEGYQMENIRHLTLVLDNHWEITRPIGCLYDMGEHFLHETSMIAGEEATMSALGELHLSELGREYDTVEDRIFEVFLKHVSSDREEAFRAFYQDVHGGAVAFEETDFSDDHGDKAELATPIAVGATAAGTLDYMFDFDYFRFPAKEGQKYSINVNHDTLRTTSVGLYAPDGITGVNRSWIARELVSTGPRIVWIAPNSDDYYAAVHNFGGETGRYTLTINAVDDATDDHGDTPAVATRISLGKIFRGAVNDDLDIDYFVFPVERDQEYTVLVTSETLEEFHFRLLLDERYWDFDAGAFRSWDPPGFGFRARSSGDAALAINGMDGSVGTYMLEVVVDEPRD